MKTLGRMGTCPVSLPLSADDIIEFHAARLLLLFRVCGVSGRIDSLTKMAKLDFFSRYPEFFEIARNSLNQTDNADELAQTEDSDEAVESAMIRHHYGPWDKRYYHILAYLESRELVEVVKSGKAYHLSLTKIGSAKANDLADSPAYASLVERMREIKKSFGSKSGNALKKLIYRIFEEEVGRRSMGEVIQR